MTAQPTQPATIAPFTDELYRFIDQYGVGAEVIQGNGEPHHPVRMRVLVNDSAGDEVRVEVSVLRLPVTTDDIAARHQAAARRAARPS